MRPLLLLWVLGLFASSVRAISPAHITDLELCERPIIVVGRWAKAKRTPHLLTKGNTALEYEVHTELVVERVLKGDIQPGVHKLLYSGFISWDDDGTFLNSASSTLHLGEVRDIKKSNIWFLNQGRSWDKEDPRDYLTIDYYRAIQAPVLEYFYKALMRPERDQLVGRLLNSSSNLVVDRTLRYMNRWRDFWPETPDHYWWSDRYAKRENRASEHAPLIRRFLDRKGHPSRGFAAGLYADMVGTEAIPLMRSYLSDPDPHVRVVAIGNLVKQRDITSYRQFASAAQGISDGYYGMNLIDRLQHAGDERLVPTIIAFLETESQGYSSEDDLGVPAVRARKALAKLTGVSFPNNVELAASEWKRAQAMPPAHRKAYLTMAFRPYQSPLKATATVDLSKARKRAVVQGSDRWVEETVKVRVAIRNTSQRPVYIAKSVGVDVRSRHGLAGGGGGLEGQGRNAFVRLAPGATYAFTTELDPFFFREKDASARVCLTQTGQKYRLKAWVGIVPAQIVRR